MNYLYLDHNIYISALEDENLSNYLKGLHSNNIQCVYSPAHIEEIHKVKINIDSPYSNKMDSLLGIIDEITNSTEVLPTTNGLIITREKVLDCYYRVSTCDTTERIKNDSIERFNIDSRHYKQALENNSHAKSISNLTDKTIWEYPEIQSFINYINANISSIIFNHNNSIEVLLFKKIGIDKTLPPNFDLKKNRFSIYKNSNTQLEYAIEVLFRILNYSGYNAEKKEATSISGTHDVSHAIYSTHTEWLVTLDKRFAKKCTAVFNYIGANTTVINCKREEIINTIESLINK